MTAPDSVVPWRSRIVRQGTTDPRDLTPNPNNPRTHPPAQMAALEGVLDEIGWIQQVVVNVTTGRMIDGHARVEKAIQRGEPTVPVVYVELSEVEERLALATFDPLGALAEVDQARMADLLKLAVTDNAAVQTLLASLKPVDVPPSGADAQTPVARPTLADRFGVPPFSVLDARQGYWQERKRQWIALGIQSELGRGEDLADGLLGISEQARSHYQSTLGAIPSNQQDLRDPNYGKRPAAPGGSLMPAANMVGPDGKAKRHGELVRGDGAGRKLGQTYGTGAVPGAGQQMTDQVVGKRDTGRLTFATGTERHDPVSKQILASGRRPGERFTLGASPTTDSVNDPQYFYKKQAVERQLGHEITTAEFQEKYYTGLDTESYQSGTSIFDPVVCELTYRWFSPPGGAVLDPFAGGSVRGIVASVLGRSYAGIDLSEHQIAANQVQAADILTGDLRPVWTVGDSRDVVALAQGEYDLVFSCPPYADLERYSDDPRDLSTLKYDAFVAAYQQIIAASLSMLKDDRFAVFVVSDVRGEGGIYRKLPGDTVRCFEAAGARLYNEAILVTALGSLPIRAGRQFEQGRKLGRTHQVVLVFVKGDPFKATQACGPVDVTMALEALETAESAVQA